MNIESQVCSFESSKKLFDLGFDIASYFCWYLYAPWYIPTVVKPSVKSKMKNMRINYAAQWAYSAAELGKMLPDNFYSYKVYNKETDWTEWYGIIENAKEIIYTSEHDTEANCRAKALIWCIENGVIKV